MRKFTAFTLMTSLVILAVGADIFANDVLPKFRKDNVETSEAVFDLPDGLPNFDVSGIGTANILGADVGINGGIVEDFDIPEIIEEPIFTDNYENVELLLETDIPTGELIPVPSSGIDRLPDNSGDPDDFENDNFVPFSTNVLLREDQIRSAGFASAYLEQEPHEGFLYKTIFIDDLYDVTATKYIVKSTNQLLAKVYVFQIGALSSLDEVYDVLKIRATEGLDMEVNEADGFGSSSFYMNDLRRPDVAFLTVKIGSYIYGFSYPKEYHAQIKNLIKLLDMEF